MTRTFWLYLALLNLAASAAFSQSLLLKKIEIEGTTPYTAAAIQANSLLYMGEMVTPSDVQLAAERLMQSGAFASVQGSVQGTPADATVVFTITMADASHFLTVGFENFVWFTPAELTADLKKMVPFFNGTIPNSPGQRYAVAAALQQMLAKQGVTTTVSQVPVQTSIGIASWIAEFRANTPAVHIRSVTLQGVPSAFAAAANAAVQSLIGTPYNEGLSPLSLSSAIRVPFQNAGYQGCTAPVVSRTIASSTAQDVEVDAVVAVNLGVLYTVSSIALPVSPLFSETQLAAMSTLQAGSVYSQSALLQTVQNITDAYHNKGYLEAAVHYSQVLNATTQQAAVSITAFAGPLFTVRSVTPVNLTPAQRAAFAANWQLPPGAVYNQGYVTSYIGSHADIQGYQTNLDTIAGPRYEVDLTITFVPGGTFTP